MKLKIELWVRGSFGVFAPEQTLLEQPLVDQDFEAHSVLDGEGGQEIDDIFGPGLLFSRQHKLLLCIRIGIPGVTPWLMMRA